MFAMRIANGFVLAASLIGCASEGSSSDPCDGASSGEACRWAGTGKKGFNAATPDADRLESKLYFPTDMTFGPDGRAYIVDWNNHYIRRVERDDTMTIVLGTEYEGDGAADFSDSLPICDPVGAPGNQVALNHPTDVKFGPDGLLYVAAWHNNKIRTVDIETGIAKTRTGDTYGFRGDGANACTALLNQPKTLVFGPNGETYTIDQRNARIRKIDAAGTITTIAGNGALGSIGDGGPALDAEFGFELVATPRPSGALALHQNNLYIADSMNNRIRRIDLATGVIDCIGGRDEPGYGGDGGPALQAQFNFPMDLEIGPDDRLYVADRYNHAIRAIDLTTNVVETVAGGALCSTDDGTCVDRADALEMTFDEPYGISFDAEGSLYVADTHNSRIVKVVR